MNNDRILTLATIVTMLGIILGGLAAWQLYLGHNFLALALFVPAAFTDLLDGYLARKNNNQGVSKFGAELDPIRDKLLLLILAIINWQLTVIVILLELISIATSGAVRKKAQRHVVTYVSKTVTVFQFICLGALILWPEKFWLFGFLYGLTLVRISSYLHTWFSLKQNRS